MKDNNSNAFYELERYSWILYIINCKGNNNRVLIVVPHKSDYEELNLAANGCFTLIEANINNHEAVQGRLTNSDTEYVITIAIFQQFSMETLQLLDEHGYLLIFVESFAMELE